MTLIYGAIDSENGFLIGDSLFTPRNKLGSQELEENNFYTFNGLFHGLKIHILKKNLAIAFSGKVFPALNTISLFYEELQKNGTRDPSALLDFYSNVIKSDNSKNDVCDFLLLDVLEKPKLFKISNGKIISDQRHCIGDNEADKKLQAKRKPYISPAISYNHLEDGSVKITKVSDTALMKERIEISNAMVLLAQEKYISVNLLINHPFVTTKNQNTNSLIFLQYIETGTCPFEGVYNFALCSSEKEPYGVGVYYSQSPIGYLFISGQVKPHRIEASTYEIFKAEVKKYFNVTLVP